MASSSDPLHFSSASNAPPPASSRSLGLQRPPSSHSALAPERAPEPEGLHVTEHERALSGRANSRAGTGAIAVKGPRKPLFDRFYDRRRGRPTVVAGAAVSWFISSRLDDGRYDLVKRVLTLENREATMMAWTKSSSQTSGTQVSAGRMTLMLLRESEG